MRRPLFRKRHPPPGSPPGTLTMPSHALPPRIHVIEYMADTLKESDVSDVNALRKHAHTPSVTWIDVQGLGDEAFLRRLGETFDMHPLAVEDIANVPQRPKSEAYDQHELFITRMLRMPAPRELEIEQLSVIIGASYVLTIQETYGDVLDPVRARIRRGGPIRRFGPDYLAYSIIDAVIDGYYPVMEDLGEYVEKLEDEVVERPTPTTLREIHRLKRDLMAVRRTVWPQRDAINALIREDSPFIGDGVRVYLRDCYDHAVQLIDVLETFRELASGLVDAYLSSVSNRMNEVMKMLTIMATIFIPLTFIAGVYGMNFQYMPELHKRWAYPALWVVMVSIAGGMLWYFRRRGWLGGGGDDDESERHDVRVGRSAKAAPREPTEPPDAS